MFFVIVLVYSISYNILSYSSLLFPFTLQALYFCVPFREQLLEYFANNKFPGDVEDNLLTCLADLFTQVISGLILVDTLGLRIQLKCDPP